MRKSSWTSAASVSSEKTRRVIVRLFNNQIDLTVKLVETITRARLVHGMEADLIREGYAAYAKLLDIRDRLSETPHDNEWQDMMRSLDALRVALEKLGESAAVPESSPSSVLAAGLRLAFENESLKREKELLERKLSRKNDDQGE